MGYEWCFMDLRMGGIRIYEWEFLGFMNGQRAGLCMDLRSGIQWVQKRVVLQVYESTVYVYGRKSSLV